MNNDIVALNTRRLQVQLLPLLRQLKPEISELFQKCVITNDKDENIKLSDIDFNKSCIFICNVDFLSLISMYALQKINKVVYPDTTSQGKYSKITTDYMIVESPEIRYSKMDLTIVEGEKIPPMYISTNYIYKDVCIWRLLLDVGQGSSQKMYSFCSERLYERYLRNQIDWCFFLGTKDQFINSYNFNFPINTYYIKIPLGTLSPSLKDLGINNHNKSEKGDLF